MFLWEKKKLTMLLVFWLLFVWGQVYKRSMETSDDEKYCLDFKFFCTQINFLKYSFIYLRSREMGRERGKGPLNWGLEMRPTALSVNQFSLECSHVHSFILSMAASALQWQSWVAGIQTWPTKLKIFITWLSAEKYLPTPALKIQFPITLENKYLGKLICNKCWQIFNGGGP